MLLSAFLLKAGSVFINTCSKSDECTLSAEKDAKDGEDRKEGSGEKNKPFSCNPYIILFTPSALSGSTCSMISFYNSNTVKGPHRTVPTPPPNRRLS